MDNVKKQQTIARRQSKEKSALLEQFQKMPVVEAACSRAGVSRATYYRWREGDAGFAEAADAAIGGGIEFLNDFAETQHIALMKDKHWPAIRHWLEHRNPKYAKNVHVQGQLDIVFPYEQPQ